MRDNIPKVESTIQISPIDHLPISGRKLWHVGPGSRIVRAPMLVSLSILAIALSASSGIADDLFDDAPGSPIGANCMPVVNASVNETVKARQLPCLVMNGSIGLYEFDPKGNFVDSDLVTFSVDPKNANRSLMTIASEGTGEGGNISFQCGPPRGLICLSEPNAEFGAETLTYRTRNSVTKKRGIYTITSDSATGDAPEPATLMLIGTGIAGLGGVWRRRLRWT